VVAGFSDPRVRHVRRDVDIGFVENFERSLEGVTTDYVTVLPDDDLMRPQKLEIAVRIMDANPSAGLLHSRFDDVDPKDRILRSNVDPTRGRLVGDTVEPGHRFIRSAIRTGSHVAFPTNFVRTAALPSPRFDPADGLAIDLGLWLHLALDWDVAFVAAPLAAVRNHGSMLSSTAGFFRGDRYVEGVAMIRQARDVKMRFLQDHGSRFADRNRLVRDAQLASRRDMQHAVWNLRVASGQVAPSLKALVEGIRHEPSMLVDPATYGLAGAILVGPAVAEPVRARIFGPP
jgi:hypothetical protein